MATATSEGRIAVKSRQTKVGKEGVERQRKAQKAALVFKQASDPTRLQILQRLALREWHVGALCEEFEMSQAAVSHHLALLRHGGLITCHREGKKSIYTLTTPGVELVEIVQKLTD